MEAPIMVGQDLATIWFGNQKENEPNCNEMRTVLLKHFIASINPCVQYIQFEFTVSFSDKQKVTLKTLQQKPP